jgi:UPF0176 protein
MPAYSVFALYKFFDFDDFQEWQNKLKTHCKSSGIKGTILLSPEGINGTVAGPRQSLEDLAALLKTDDRMDDLVIKMSESPEMPFLRMKVKLKKEVIPMGRPTPKPSEVTGTFVKPEDWNDLISDPDVILIDTRNDYEVRLGTFKGAIDPKTENFSDFPAFIEKQKELKPETKVAMFCTGGIRCEKASAYMLDEGFEEIFQLKGGILNYLETVPQDKSLWEGDCFIFDNRVALDHDLEPTDHDLCFGCREPVAPDEKSHPNYEAGVSCMRCAGSHDEKKLANLRQRQMQLELAKSRNEPHIGDEARALQEWKKNKSRAA